MLTFLHGLPYLVQLCIVLLGLTGALQTLIATVQRLVPVPWRTYIEKRWPRLAWAAKASRTGVNDLAKFLGACLNVLRGISYPSAPATPPPPLPRRPGGGTLVVVGLCFVALGGLVDTSGCAGTTTSVGINGGGNGTSWTAGITIGITVAQAAAPVAQAVLDADLSIPAGTRAQMDQGFAVFEASLTQLAQITRDVAMDTSLAGQCRASAIVEQAVTEGVQIVQMLTAVGVKAPPGLAGIVSSIGTIADELVPACPSGGNPAAERLSAQRRVAQALAGR